MSGAHQLWTSCLSRCLYRLQQQGLFCDTILKSSDGQVFKVHSCVLAAVSPFLQLQMLALQQRGASIQTTASTQELNWILDYIYTGDVDTMDISMDIKSLTSNILKLGIVLPAQIVQKSVVATRSLAGGSPTVNPSLPSTESPTNEGDGGGGGGQKFTPFTIGDVLSTLQPEEEIATDSGEEEEEEEEEEEGDQGDEDDDMGLDMEEQSDSREEGLKGRDLEEKGLEEAELEELDRLEEEDEAMEKDVSNMEADSDSHSETLTSSSNHTATAQQSAKHTPKKPSAKAGKNASASAQKPVDTDAESSFECSDCGAECLSKAFLDQHWDIEHRTVFDCKKCSRILNTRSGYLSHCKMHESAKKKAVYYCEVCQAAFPTKVKTRRHQAKQHKGHSREGVFKRKTQGASSKAPPHAASPKALPQAAIPKAPPHSPKAPPHTASPKAPPHGASPKAPPHAASPKAPPHGASSKALPHGASPKALPHRVILNTLLHGASPKALPHGASPKANPHRANPRKAQHPQASPKPSITKPAFTSNKPKCRHCPKVFFSLALRNWHEKEHADLDDPLQCRFCWKKFSTRSQVAAHAATHTGDRPYRCRCCNEAFADREVMLEHETEKQKAARFPCFFCPQSFKNKVQRLEHYQAQHGWNQGQKGTKVKKVK